MPSLKKAAAHNKVQETNEFKEALMSLGASISFKLFSLSFALGFAALLATGLAIVMTAPKPDTSTWPYAEVKIIVAEEVTLDHGIEEEHPPQDQHVAEYGVAEDTSYKIDLSHDMSLYDTIDNNIVVPRRNGNKTVFKAYNTPLFDAIKNTPYKGIIALVMTDFGLSKERSIQAEELFKDIHINYAMNPYTTGAQNLIDRARAHGHEVWMTIPMEPEKFPLVETGPLTLLVRSKADENRRRLIWLLSTAKGFPGIIHTEDSDFIYAESEMFNLLSALHEHGVGFATALESDTSLAEKIANQTKVPFAHNNIWLGRSGRLDDLEQDIQKLEAMALKQGEPVVAMFPPYPAYISQVAKWVESAREKQNIIFVPLSYTINQKY